jgi:hypothetical protein
MLFFKKKLPIKILEMHVTHSCNLSCESCGHYSNQNHKGFIGIKTAENWMNWWNKKINPKYLSLLGGEPTMHKNLPEFVEMSHRCWPDAQIRITTNGFFLKSHPRLPEVLESTNTELKVSIHGNSPEYQNKINEIFSLVEEWQGRYQFRLITAKSENVWFRQYKGVGKHMMPYDDNDPKTSFSICKWKGCFQLHEGKIWKCAPLAYLGMQDKKYGLGTDWDFYLTYKPLGPTESYKKMKEFFSCQSEPHCAMCPSKENFFAPPSPLVSIKIN